MLKVVSGDDHEKDADPSVAEKVLTDVDRLFTEICRNIIRGELRLQGDVPESLHSRVTLHGEGALAHDARRIMHETLTYLGGPARGTFMDDTFPDVIGRRSVASAVLDIHSDLEGNVLDMPFDLEHRSNFIAVGDMRVYQLIITQRETMGEHRYGIYTNIHVRNAVKYTQEVIDALQGQTYFVDSDIAEVMGIPGMPLADMDVDIVIVVGIFAVMNWEFSLPVLAAVDFVYNETAVSCVYVLWTGDLTGENQDELYSATMTNGDMASEGDPAPLFYVAFEDAVTLCVIGVDEDGNYGEMYSSLIAFPESGKSTDYALFDEYYNALMGYAPAKVRANYVEKDVQTLLSARDFAGKASSVFCR